MSTYNFNANNLHISDRSILCESIPNAIQKKNISLKPNHCSKFRFNKARIVMSNTSTVLQRYAWNLMTFTSLRYEYLLIALYLIFYYNYAYFFLIYLFQLICKHNLTINKICSKQNTIEVFYHFLFGIRPSENVYNLNINFKDSCFPDMLQLSSNVFFRENTFFCNILKYSKNIMNTDYSYDDLLFMSLLSS